MTFNKGPLIKGHFSSLFMALRDIPMIGFELFIYIFIYILVSIYANMCCTMYTCM